ncbi:MAG: DNA-deoxyinosine glycosylase [Alphaproteobacteria bacterium]|nr:DNA-deoxyinosine glycosylase [Alphaproteobacteria bacterium]
MEDEDSAQAIKRSFPPIVDGQVRLMVLGSLPGDISLTAGRYYANPRNHFWSLIGAVIEKDLVALDYEARLEALLAAHVGLWDTVESAERSGSLDTNIRTHQPNRLPELAASLPELAAFGFNGGKAAAIGTRQLAGASGLQLIALPSSSPAFTLPFARKLEQWLGLRRFL